MPDFDTKAEPMECDHPTDDPRWTCSACITHLAAHLDRSDR